MGLKRLKQELLNFLNEQNEEEKMTWESFQQILSDTLDADIILYSRQSGKQYIGGKCHISGKISENMFSKKTELVIEAQLYFREVSSSNAELRTITRKCDYNLFTDDAETVSMLKQALHESFEFEVSMPEMPEDGKE